MASQCHNKHSIKTLFLEIFRFWITFFFILFKTPRNTEILIESEKCTDVVQGSVAGISTQHHREAFQCGESTGTHHLGSPAHNFIWLSIFRF